MWNTLLTVVWDVNPVAIELGPLAIRWYGLIYALGFLFATWLIGRMFKSEGYPEEWADKVFLYLVIAVVVGSRLGHVFFYDWAYYSQHPAEILMVWKGGLASHGGAIAIIITVWLMAKYMCHKSFKWLGDRIYVICAPVAALIRIGNLMNSEIYGCPTSLPWGFIFVRGNENPGIACHPTQLYESLAYLLMFLFMLWLYWKTDARKRSGLLMGVGFLWTFAARFLIEFVKNDQSDFEAGMIINMGQCLSIPFILLGLGLIINAYRRPIES